MSNNNNPNIINARAFRKGLRQLRVMDAQAARKEIMSVLGVTTKQSFQRYANGKANLDVVKAARIAAVFTKYGVNDCWGGSDDGKARH